MTSRVSVASSPPTTDRFDSIQVAFRVAVVLAGLATVASIRLAASDPQPLLDVAIVLVVALGALFPDGHLGLVAIALVGIDWVLAVDDPTTPWVLAAGAALAAFHSSLALATVAPIGARLERATCVRWARRTAAIAALLPPTWLAVVVVERLDVGTSQLLVGVALMAVALTAMWSRRGDLGSG